MYPTPHTNNLNCTETTCISWSTIKHMNVCNDRNTALFKPNTGAILNKMISFIVQSKLNIYRHLKKVNLNITILEQADWLLLSILDVFYTTGVTTIVMVEQKFALFPKQNEQLCHARLVYKTQLGTITYMFYSKCMILPFRQLTKLLPLLLQSNEVCT